jgi:CubicO group peptidase (beta-lactamase class C family)
LNHAGLLAADASIRALPELAHTVKLLVAQGGEIVFERCYRGSAPDDLHCLHSVTKSFTSTLVGMLVGDGALSLDAPVASLIDAPALRNDPAKGEITVRHLLTMSSGLYGHGWWDIDELEDRGEPVVEGVLAAPLVAPPGWGFLYNNGASHVLSAVIEAVAGIRLDQFAAARLFAPIGIERWSWSTDPQGQPWGCSGLELTARDLLKLGLLYLNHGRWDGTPLVHEDYLRTAISPLVEGGPPERCGYGLLWWVADRAPRPSYFAGGYGGQYVVVVPDLDLVVVTMGDADAMARPPMGLMLRRLVHDQVVPAFEAEAGVA